MPSSRRRAVVLGLVGPLVVAAAAVAAPTWEVAREDRWKPGDVVTVTTTDERYQEIRFPAREAEAPSKPRRLLGKVVAVETCLETDLEGHRTRWTTWFRAWAYDNGETKDTSLEGTVVEVAGRGKERTYKVVSGPTPPSKPATAWLARAYGAGRPDGEAARRAWLPKVAVAVGDEWGADLAAVLDGLYGAESIDRAKATAMARLAKVEDGRASLVCEAKLPVTALPGGKAGKAVPWTSGGTYVVKGTLVTGLGDGVPESDFVVSASLEGEAEADGHAVAVRWKTDRKVELRRGGEAPPK